MLKRKRTTLDEIKEAKGYVYTHAHIPHEVLLQILQKLPIKALMKFCCVCKLWSESILNDPRFIEAHFFESQKNPQLIFKFLPKKLDGIEYPYNFLSENEEYRMNHLFSLGKDKFVNGKSKVLPYIENLIVSKNSSPRRLIGYCNGLVCFMVGVPFKTSCGSYYIIEIFNFSKLEKLRIVSRIQTQGSTWVKDCRFGYDVIAKEYKLMCILGYRGTDYTAGSYYKYIILTLDSTGTHQSWREIKHPMTPKGYPRGYSYQSPGHCIDGALFWTTSDMDQRYKKVLYSFNLHEEKFQVIKLPDGLYGTDYKNQLEHERCFCCVQVMPSSSTHSGAVELFILRDRIEQVWVKKTFVFHLPRTVGKPPPALPHCDFKCCATFSLNKEGITSIRITEFAGRIYLYWRRLLQHKRSHIIQFYDLLSKKVMQVKGPTGGKFGYDYHVTSHVENLVSLKAWETNEGDGGGVLVGRQFDKCTITKIQDMFKKMPPSSDAAMVFFSSLSLSGKNNESLVI